MQPTDEVTPTDTTPQMVLNVEVINAAYAALKQALQDKMYSDLAECQQLYYNEPEKEKEQEVAIHARWGIELARCEVDRVGAIQSFFQISSLNMLAVAAPDYNEA